MEIKINLKIFAFVAIFYLTGQLEIYGILMLFAFLHEMGHMLAGLVFGFKPKSLKVMPLGLAIRFATFPKDYNGKIGNANLLTVKKLGIALAGPITNLVFIVLLLFLPNFSLFGLEKSLLIYSNLLIAIFNLLPIYPLDGGRVIKYFLRLKRGNKRATITINRISNLTVILLTMVSSILIYYYKNIAILLIIIYLWILVILQNRKFENQMKLYRLIENNT